MTSTEIFILEDDLTMRAMLRAILLRAGYRPTFFADGDALLLRARQVCPACVLLDLCLPGKSGLDVLDALRREAYPAPVLMISGQGDIPVAVRALRLGAADFVEKPFRADDLIARIEAAGAEVRADPAIPVQHYKDSWRLSKREKEVLEHLLVGSTTKVIARQLNLSPRTIEDHRASIMRKAGVRTTAQLAVAAFEDERGREVTSSNGFARGEASGWLATSP